MLIVATLLALFIGYGQQRRRFILRECEALKADQVQFNLSDAWIDKVWQRQPTNIIVTSDLLGGWDTAENRARIRLERLDWEFKYMGPTMIEMVN